MRCKKHLTDSSSCVGVCASCLSERLLILVAAQAQDRAHHALEDRRKSDSELPLPLAFPRSVSPYICSRKSEHVSVNNRRQKFPDHRLFFSTPQVDLCKKQGNGLSLLKKLFRSGSSKPESDPGVSGWVQNSGHSCSEPTASAPSWFSAVILRRQEKRSRQSIADKRQRNIDRGMSPSRISDSEDERESQGRSSGYSSTLSRGWRRTPDTAANPARRGGGEPDLPRTVSGLGFCLSPLGRASPSRQRNQKGILGEIAGGARAPVKTQSSAAAAASFCADRSKKLSDFWRFDRNH